MASNEGGRKWKSSKTEECIEFQFDWRINNFLEVIKDSIDSPNFGGPTKFGEVSCHVTTFVSKIGENEAREEYLCACFSLGLRRPQESMNQQEISILGSDGQKLSTKTKELTVSDRTKTDALIPFKDIVKQNDLYLPNGSLTLHYEGKVWISVESSDKEKVPVRTLNSNITLMVLKLIGSGSIRDVTIKAGNREFKCHKSVLSTRSEYFRAMFESGMKESQEGVVDFSEQMDGDSLKSLVEYIYSGRASNLKLTCKKMLKIADMFQLDDLKSQCEEELIRQLSPDNALDVAVFARDYGAKKLLKKAICLLYKCV